MDETRARDASLIDEPAGSELAHDEGFVPTTHRGLVYPMGARVPAMGEILAIAPGVGWARIAMPGPLSHINVWLLDDRDAAGEGVAIVDTGMGVDSCRESWEALFAGPLVGRRVTRVIATHLHPDHVGLAGWLCERWAAPLLMTRTEWLTARMLQADRRDAPPPEARRWWRTAGYDDAQIAAASANGWSMFASITSPIPASYQRIAEGDLIEIGTRGWRVVIGTGHTPEHACLIDEAGGLMIAGDQVLPRITSNVSVGIIEPAGDPLGDWLNSIEKLLGQLPAGLLVLPAHGEIFTGLHIRLAALRDGHLDRLDALVAALDRPKTAMEVFGVLFRREIGVRERGMAAGEALAHLHRLERTGRARRIVEEGVARFVAA